VIFKQTKKSHSKNEMSDSSSSCSSSHQNDRRIHTRQQLEKSSHKRKDIAPITLTHSNYLEKLPLEERKSIVIQERLKRLLFFEESVPSPVETDEECLKLILERKKKPKSTACEVNEDEEEDSNIQMQLLTLAYLTSLGKHDYLCKKTRLNEIDRELNDKLMDLDLFVKAVVENQSEAKHKKNNEQVEVLKNKESGNRRKRNG
jgi:hypothetical protein